MITEEQSIMLRQQALNAAVAQNPQTDIKRLLEFADKIYKFLVTGTIPTSTTEE